MSENNFTKHLKVPFTAEELDCFKNQLSEGITELQNAESEKKDVTTSLNAKIEAAKSSITHINNKIRDKCEYRMVKCEAINLDFEKNTKDIVRTDTREIIETIELTETDRQLNLISDKIENALEEEFKDDTEISTKVEK